MMHKKANLVVSAMSHDVSVSYGLQVFTYEGLPVKPKSSCGQPGLFDIILTLCSCEQFSVFPFLNKKEL